MKWSRKLERNREAVEGRCVSDKRDPSLLNAPGALGLGWAVGSGDFPWAASAAGSAGPGTELAPESESIRKGERVRKLLPFGRHSQLPSIRERAGLWLPLHILFLLVVQGSPCLNWLPNHLPALTAVLPRSPRPSSRTAFLALCFHLCIHSTSCSKLSPPWRHGLCFPLTPWVWNTGSQNPLESSDESFCTDYLEVQEVSSLAGSR